MNSADSAYIDGLRRTTDAALLEAIGSSREVAIIDAPNQRNVGDSLIWAGELAYVERLGLNVRYVADLWSYDPAALRRLLPSSGVVLLHGGGNFGDLWLGHQLFREQVVADLTEYRIVQLPQSVFFADDQRARQADKVLSRHPDFHVLLRDHLSIERAQRWLPNLATTFCPDMALGWDAPASFHRRVDPGKIVAIARADKEALSGLASVHSDWVNGARTEVVDWAPTGVPGSRWNRARRAAKLQRGYVKARRSVTSLPVGGMDRLGARIIGRINSANIDGAVELYAPAQVIVVDRLHAHILAALLDIPHVVLDNSYRKVSAIFDDYSGGLTSAHFAHNLSEASAVAAQYVEQ